MTLDELRKHIDSGDGWDAISPNQTRILLNIIEEQQKALKFYASRGNWFCDNFIGVINGKPVGNALAHETLEAGRKRLGEL